MRKGEELDEKQRPVWFLPWHTKLSQADPAWQYTSPQRYERPPEKTPTLHRFRETFPEFTTPRGNSNWAREESGGPSHSSSSKIVAGAKAINKVNNRRCGDIGIWKTCQSGNLPSNKLTLPNLPKSDVKADASLKRNSLLVTNQSQKENKNCKNNSKCVKNADNFEVKFTYLKLSWYRKGTTLNTDFTSLNSSEVTFERIEKKPDQNFNTILSVKP